MASVRAASKLRIAALRLDKARRSYRSRAASSEIFCVKMIASFSSLSEGMGLNISLTSWTSIGGPRKRAPRARCNSRSRCLWTCRGRKLGSTKNCVIKSLRLFRTRSRSNWASAIRSARSTVSASAQEPESLRAIASIFGASKGFERTGTFKPCRKAFCPARAFPAAVLGPVLDLALARLARCWRSLVKGGAAPPIYPVSTSRNSAS